MVANLLIESTEGSNLKLNKFDLNHMARRIWLSVIIFVDFLCVVNFKYACANILFRFMCHTCKRSKINLGLHTYIDEKRNFYMRTCMLILLIRHYLEWEKIIVVMSLRKRIFFINYFMKRIQHMHETVNIAYNYLKCASFFCTAFSIRMTAICMHKALAWNNKKKTTNLC